MQNKGLNKTIKEIRSRGLKKYKGNNRIISWQEKDYLKGNTVDAAVIILPTSGCRDRKSVV